MNNLLATTFSAIITAENDQFYFLQKEDNIIRLAKSEGDHQIGDIVTGFADMDKSDKMCLTTQ